tara:strand:+ start:3344 stop:4492 length:1149 start_codon:yes stop_codon:yes gene_type:complete
MESNLIYHSVAPENVLESYTEFSNVDFVLTFDGRAIELNTIRVTADCVVEATNELKDKTANTNIFYNASTGGNGVVENITTTINGRVVESYNDVGRFCSMKNQSEVGSNERLKGSMSAKGITINDRFTNSLIRGSPSGKITGNSYPANTHIEPFNFTITPECCLNNAYSPDGSAPLLSSSKSGKIQLSLRLARNTAFLYGSDVGANNGRYKLQNIKCSYVSRPDVKDKEVMMRSKISIKQSVQSDSASIGAVVPNVCNAVSISFQPQARENSSAYDNYKLHRIPNLDQMSYLFNDSSNQYLSFLLRTNIEAMERGMDSFRATGSNQAQLVRLNSNDGAVYGLSFSEYIPLMNQKFSVVINSGIGSTGENYLAYLYFHSLISM